LAHDHHTVCVFAPLLTLTITVEAGRDDSPDIHIHPGGQGFWISRMLRHLGERPLLCSPVGGEVGRVIRGLMAQWGIDLSPVETGFESPSTVQDRRGGDRVVIAETPPRPLDRHALDDAYGRFLDHALGSEVCVISGQPEEIVPVETYRRMAHDLAVAGVVVVGDLHGPELDALLDGGPIDYLKVSDEDLKSDGTLTGDGDREAVEAIRALEEKGARNVVVSRAHEPVLASIEGRSYRATVPELEPADFRGAGDSMTAGLATAVRRGLSAEETLQLACGAGAANVTRHGLGSASEELVPRLASLVQVETASPTRP
jgi:1-phosphofructokinase